MSSQESVTLWRKWSHILRNWREPELRGTYFPPALAMRFVYREGLPGGRKHGKKRGKVRVIASKRIEVDERTGEPYEVTEYDSGKVEVCRFATPHTPNEVVFNYGEYVRLYGHHYLN